MMPSTKSDEGEEREQAGDPELDAGGRRWLARLGAALAAVAAQGAEQADVDRHDDDRGGDEADPNAGC